MSLIVGSLLGGIAVIAGAFGSHGLDLTPEKMETYELAVHYQLFHGLLLVAVGYLPEKSTRWLTGIILGGVVLFSGSLYGWAVADLRIFLPLTPVGGTLLIIGWGYLVYIGWSRRSSQ